MMSLSPDMQISKHAESMAVTAPLVDTHLRPAHGCHARYCVHTIHRSLQSATSIIGASLCSPGGCPRV